MKKCTSFFSWALLLLITTPFFSLKATEISIQCADEAPLTLDTRLLCLSGTLQNLYDDAQGTDQPLSLPDISAATMEKIIEYFKFLDYWPSMWGFTKEITELADPKSDWYNSQRLHLLNKIKRDKLTEDTLDNLLKAATFLDAYLLQDVLFEIALPHLSAVLKEKEKNLSPVFKTLKSLGTPFEETISSFEAAVNQVDWDIQRKFISTNVLNNIAQFQNSYGLKELKTFHFDNTTLWFDELTLSPDGTYCTFLNRESLSTPEQSPATINVLALLTGETKQLPPSTIDSIRWSPNGRYFASASRETITLWNPQTWTVDRELTFPSISQENTLQVSIIASITWSPESTYLACTSNNICVIWNTTSWEIYTTITIPLTTQEASFFDSMKTSWSPSGNRLAIFIFPHLYHSSRNFFRLHPYLFELHSKELKKLNSIADISQESSLTWLNEKCLAYSAGQFITLYDIDKQFVSNHLLTMPQSTELIEGPFTPLMTILSNNEISLCNSKNSRLTLENTRPLNGWRIIKATWSVRGNVLAVLEEQENMGDTQLRIYKLGSSLPTLQEVIEKTMSDIDNNSTP